jgi:exosortase F-associated protein
MTRTVRLTGIIIGFLLLIGFRSLAQRWFYDPLQDYFRNDYLANPVPPVELGLYFFHLMLRYLVNTVLSLGIIYLVFMKRSVILFCIRFYIVAFFLFGLGIFAMLFLEIEAHYLLLFYLRRFLIHPIFVLVLIPAFYIYKYADKEQQVSVK